MKNTETKTETGHSRNVANFNALIAGCKGQGPKYQPANPRLAIPFLEVQAADAAKAVEIAQAANNDLVYATANRAESFNAVRVLSTRILGAVESYDHVPEGVLEAARSINRRIHGQASLLTQQKDRAAEQAAHKATAEDPVMPEGNTISRAHQSFFRVAESLGGFHVLLSRASFYQPAEADLTIDSISNTVQELYKRNDLVRDAALAADSAKITRDNLLYTPETGLVATALKVKQYVKSAFRASAPEYGQINGIHFRMFT